MVTAETMPDTFKAVEREDRAAIAAVAQERGGLSGQPKPTSG